MIFAEDDIDDLDDRVTVNESDIDGLQFHDLGFDWTPGGLVTGASAIGTGSTAMGDGASSADFDTAVGYRATVTADGSVAVGSQSQVDSANSVALGADSVIASGAEGGVALGQNAQVLTGATGSVAIGQDSVADQANTVSVGSATNQRRIINVAYGIEDTDAVNIYQLRQTEMNFQNLMDTNMATVDNRIDDVNDRLDDVGAFSAAFSALIPNARAAGDTQLSVGMGGYKGTSAIAAGVFHYFDDNILVNAGLSHGFGEGETAVRAGVTIGW